MKRILHSRNTPAWVLAVGLILGAMGAPAKAGTPCSCNSFSSDVSILTTNPALNLTQTSNGRSFQIFNSSDDELEFRYSNGLLPFETKASISSDGDFWVQSSLTIGGGTLFAGNGWQLQFTPQGLDFHGPGPVGVDATLRPDGHLVLRGQVLTSSSRAVKDRIEPVDSARLLSLVKSLTISAWSYKDQVGESRHLGPMAEDFHRVFGLGIDSTTLAPADVAGVALGAVQAIGAEVNLIDAERLALEQENRVLREQIVVLANRLGALEARLGAR